MAYLLDTNIVSNVTKPRPSQSLLDWMGAQRNADLFIASLTVADVRRGILAMPPGRKRRALEGWFDGADGPRMLFAGRVLPFDDNAAMIWARLMAEGDASGRLRSGLDMIIAAIAEANGYTVVTDNLRDFFGIATFNPIDPEDR